jgi:L-ribulose-5-phosphate 3-epimerase
MSDRIRASRLGICSWSLQPTSIEGLLGDLGGLGASGVQLALGPLLDEPRQWPDAIQRLREAGFEVFSGMLEACGEDYSSLESIKATGGVVPDETWPHTLARAEAVAAVASEAGLSLVTVHAGFIPHDERDPARVKVLERLRTLGDLFAKGGTKLGLETGQESAATLCGALDRLDHPNIGVNFDPANMILYGMGDPVEALSTLAPYVVQVHAKDALPSTTPGTWGSEVPLGDGAVDWTAFGQVVNSLEPAVNVVIEREAGEQRSVDIATALARLGDS